jgi:hypothetical protein
MNMLKYLNASSRRYGPVFYPLLVIFSGGILFYVFPFRVVPDFANIKTYTKIYELFNLIITSLVSLIGIYISVSLVAYEFFKQRSGIDFHKSFLVNRVNAYYISFSVSTILFTFISSILISSVAPTWSEVSVIYYNALLFLFVIACLFPVAFNLFSSLKPERLAHDELQLINNNTIFIQTSPLQDIDSQAKLFENDHLIRIESIVIALISVSDSIKAQAIMQKATLKLTNLIIDESNLTNKVYITGRLISFYIKIIDFALLQPNNTAILKSIWLGIARMYSIIIERKESIKHLETFREQFFERFFNRLLDNNKEELLFEGVAVLRHVIQKQVLFNTADETKLYVLNDLRRSIEKDFQEPQSYTDEDYENAEQWREVAIETMGCITFLINKSISLHKPTLLNKCFEQINELNYQLRLKGSGIYKQCFFYINSANIICDYAYEAFKENVFIKGHDAKHLMPTAFENLITEKHPAARTVLQKYCYLLIKLQKIGKLDRWFLGGLVIGDFMTTEGALGHIAKRCAIKYKDGNVVQNCLEDCISTFRILKEYYEKHPPSNFGLYSIIKWQYENILAWMEKEQNDEQVVIRELKELISSFKDNAESDNNDESQEQR